ncbi:hypothetical protein [Gimesia maris]|uniref:hypothetical protein n=1 Tax=Gimesia maris TaxID=122 RepID=UPI0030D80940|tara:strand:- start:22409 stop:23044 length:636 start_codon:yes stop_codon:yes gene_type:complete
MDSDSILRQKYIDIEYGKNSVEATAYINNALARYATYEKRIWNVFNESPRKVEKYDIVLVPIHPRSLSLILLGISESWYLVDSLNVPESVSEIEQINRDYGLFKFDTMGREFYTSALIPATTKLVLSELQSTLVQNEYVCSRNNLNWAINLVKKYGQVAAFIPQEPDYAFLLINECKPVQHWLDIVNHEDFEGFVWSAKSRILFEKGNLGI